MARKQLHFNSSRAIADFKSKMIMVADDLINEYYAEVYNKLRTNSGKGSLDKLSENQENYLRRKVIGYAMAIMDSYGTGSKMDKNNPFLNEYMNSSLWNDLRTGYEITGRKKGTYKNIYGATDYSSGSMAGENVESIAKPTTPSYAFQNAEIWFFQGGRTKQVLNLVIGEYCRGMYKYFEYR